MYIKNVGKLWRQKYVNGYKAVASEKKKNQTERLNV